MTELKTINDIKKVRIIDENPTHPDFINENELKAVAVKRYNYFNKEREKTKNGSNIWLVLTGRIEEIIEMNNLTDEDLKDEDAFDLTTNCGKIPEDLK